ncbi:MAG: efflux transporter outer membrane subunit [Casimicrobiaceae bacterium]
MRFRLPIDAIARSLLRAAAPVLVGLAVAACAVGPEFKRPDAPAADRYTANEDETRLPPGLAGTPQEPRQHVSLGARASADWWTLFRSNELDAAVLQALAGSPTLVAASATLAQAQALVVAQAGTLYPQVMLGAGVGRQKYGAQFLGPAAPLPPFNYFAVGPSVSYALDYTGGAARSVEQRQALADFQAQQLRAARLALTGNVVMQAMAVMSARAQMAAIESLLADDRRNLDLVQASFDAGSVARVDVLSAQSQLANDQTLLPPLRQQVSVAQHALAILAGRAPANRTPSPFDLSALSLPQELPVSLPSELVHRRPDILAAEAQLHAATASVGVAAADLYPHINLTASGGLQALTLQSLFEPSSLVFSLAAGLTAPLFDGGTLRAEHRAATEAMRASAANYQQTVLQAFKQVADALEALQHDAELLDAQAKALDSARANADLARESYRAGNVGVLQVLDAQRLFQGARLGYVRAKAQRYVDTAQLFLALGGTDAEADWREVPPDSAAR